MAVGWVGNEEKGEISYLKFKLDCGITNLLKMKRDLNITVVNEFVSDKHGLLNRSDKPELVENSLKDS